MQEAEKERLLLYQKWRDLIFLHWEWDAEEIQSGLPEGLEVDLYEGSAYLAVVAFRMRQLRLRGLPSFSPISDFWELNLRTYVRDRQGRCGVWFYSLEAASWTSVKIANTFFHLPYRWATMSGEKASGRIIYRAMRRRDPDKRRMTCSVRLDGEPVFRTAEPGSLEHFFVERYRLFTCRERDGRLYTGAISHLPYAICEAEPQGCARPLFELNCFQPPESPPMSALFSTGVDVSLMGLKAVDRRMIPTNGPKP